MEKGEWQISTNAQRILQELEEFEHDRKENGPPLSHDDLENIRILRRDAMHHMIQERDKMAFGEMARLKDVELQYLHQILGIRQQGPSAIFGSGYCGYGNGWTGNKMRLLYAQNRKRYGRKSREVFMPIQLQGSTTYMEEELVPIRIDFENEKFKLQDSFTWNLKDTTIPLEVFVENLLEDFHLPLTLSPHIVQSIKEQLDGYCFHVEPRIQELEEATKEMEDVEMTDAYEVKTEAEAPEAKAPSVPPAVPTPSAPSVPAPATAQGPAAGSHTHGLGPVKPGEPRPVNTDMRITIKLDISIGQHVLNDQFEWDMNCTENSPEEFATVMCAELALAPEFATAIAHSIREQCQAHTKMLYVVGYQFDGRPPQDSDFKQEMSPEVSAHSFLRNPMLLPSFSPILHEVPISDFEKHDQDREGRRRRRQGRSSRRGLASTYPVPAQLGAQVTVNDLKETSRSTDTPVFSALLPGGLDPNLAILRATATGLDENSDNGSEAVAYYMRIRNRKDIPSGSLFMRDQPESHQQRYIVKLKIPTAAEMQQRAEQRAAAAAAAAAAQVRVQAEAAARAVAQAQAQAQAQALRESHSVSPHPGADMQGRGPMHPGSHGHNSSNHTPHTHTPHGHTPHGHTPHAHTPHMAHVSARPPHASHAPPQPSHIPQVPHASRIGQVPQAPVTTQMPQIPQVPQAPVNTQIPQIPQPPQASQAPQPPQASQPPQAQTDQTSTFGNMGADHMDGIDDDFTNFESEFFNGY